MTNVDALIAGLERARFNYDGDDAIIEAQEALKTLSAALAEAQRERDMAMQELRNITQAHRFDREAFCTDEEFARWAISRAGHTLAAIAEGRGK